MHENSDFNKTQPTEPELSGFSIQSGNTTFVVRVHFNEESEETMADKIERMIRRDIQTGSCG